MAGMANWFRIAAIEPRNSERGVSTHAMALEMLGMDPMPAVYLKKGDRITIHPVSKRDNGDFKMHNEIAELKEIEFQFLISHGVYGVRDRYVVYMLPAKWDW